MNANQHNGPARDKNVAHKPPKVTLPVQVRLPVAVDGHVNPVEVPLASQNAGAANWVFE